MAFDGSRRNGNRAALWTIAVVGACTVLFLPMMSGGFCADSPVPGGSYCESHQRSIVGIDTSVWVWLVVTTVAAGIALALTVRQSP